MTTRTTTRTNILRSLLGLGASTALALGAAAALAPTAEAAAPASVTVTAAPTSGGAQITVLVPLAAKDIGSASCTVDGSAVGCGAPVAAGKTSTSYAPSLSGLTGGDHTFTIKVSKAEKNTRKSPAVLTGSTTFAPLADPQTACDSAGGAFSPTGTHWECDVFYDLSTVTDSLLASQHALLASACPVALNVSDSVLLVTQQEFLSYFCSPA